MSVIFYLTYVNCNAPACHVCTKVNAWEYVRSLGDCIPPLTGWVSPANMAKCLSSSSVYICHLEMGHRDTENKEIEGEMGRYKRRQCMREKKKKGGRMYSVITDLRQTLHKQLFSAAKSHCLVFPSLFWLHFHIKWAVCLCVSLYLMGWCVWVNEEQ